MDCKFFFSKLVPRGKRWVWLFFNLLFHGSSKSQKRQHDQVCLAQQQQQILYYLHALLLKYSLLHSPKSLYVTHSPHMLRRSFCFDVMYFRQTDKSSREKKKNRNHAAMNVHFLFCFTMKHWKIYKSFNDFLLFDPAQLYSIRIKREEGTSFHCRTKSHCGTIVKKNKIHICGSIDLL